MSRFIQLIFFALIVRPIILVVIGLNVRRQKELPQDGPAIIVANHNSHLDTVVLMTLLPLSRLRKIRPVAAADYFLKNKLLAWFSREIMGIIPLKRTADGASLDERLSGVFQALDRGEILILFPEGSRGEPEKMAKFKSGVAYIAEKYPMVPVYPVFLHGLGKSLPKGEALLVPFFCDVLIGDKLFWNGNSRAFMDHLETSMVGLASGGGFPSWE
jgi:1-acyl-sn-glycerol-3-phosphate acyltransferase